MGTGEEEGAGGEEGVDRRGQEENQTMRIIERLRKLKKGAEERQQAYSTMEYYFVELGKKLPNDEIQRSFANAISDLAGGIQELYGVVNILTQMVTEESIRRQQQQLDNNSNKKKHMLLAIIALSRAAYPSSPFSFLLLLSDRDHLVIVARVPSLIRRSFFPSSEPLSLSALMSLCNAPSSKSPKPLSKYHQSPH